jgi:hypothetical protein
MEDSGTIQNLALGGFASNGELGMRGGSYCLRHWTIAKIVRLQPDLHCVSPAILPAVYIIRGTRCGGRELLLSFPRALVPDSALEQ